MGDYGGGRAEVGGGLAMETVLPVDDFQSLGGDQQSESAVLGRAAAKLHAAAVRSERSRSREGALTLARRCAAWP